MSGDEGILFLEPGVPGLYLKLFVGISAAIFGVLAVVLILLGTVEETFREHRNNLLYLFLLVSPAVGFFLATLLNRTFAALWGTVFIHGESGTVVKRRWRDAYRLPLRNVTAVQLCPENEGRSQLNLISRREGGAAERRFLFHHADREYLRQLGEMLAETYGLDFVEH